MTFVRPTLAFLGALLVTIILGSMASAHFVLNGLTDLGVSIPVGDRISMMLEDIVGMGPLYGVLIGIGLLIAFIVAIFVTRLAPQLRWFVYLVAGGTAVAVTLVTLKAAFGIMPIGGARTMGGFVTQVAIGALAGYLYVRFNPARETA